jgi:putative ATP-binding cassette transporter
LTPEEFEAPIPDEKIIATLRALHIDTVLTRTGGLDTEHDWESMLSVHEQQLISFARILLASPRFAVLDLGNMALNAETIARMLKMLSTANISYLIMGRQGQQDADAWLDCYDAVLEVKPGGGWEWQAARGGVTPGDGGATSTPGRFPPAPDSA